MKISVIVPVYNTDKFLDKCLASIQKQTFTDFEVIVVNDGSTDESETIINRYLDLDARFCYIKKENGGLSTARNTGLKCAKGDFVCFVDSDDYLGERYLEDLEKYAINDVDIVIAKYSIEDAIAGKSYVPESDERIVHLYEGEEKYEKIFLKHAGLPNKHEQDELKGTLMCVWKNLYRRDLIEKLNISFISERLVMYEDYAFNLEMYYAANKIYLIDSVQYVHNVLPNSLSRKYRENYFEMILNLYDYSKKCYQKYGLNFNNIANARLNRMILKMILDVMYNATYLKTERLYPRIKCVVNHPRTRELIKQVDSIQLEFYYSFLLFLLRHRLILVLSFSLRMFRILEKWYRLYRFKRS